MQEQQITLDSKLFNKIYNFLKHPLITLSIGILIPTVIAFLSADEKKPSYFFSTPQLIAQSEDEKDNLKILWKEEIVSNVYSVDFTFWNNGRKYIDPIDFIDTNPIKIHNSGQVNILSVTQSHISRDAIIFRSIINDSLRNSAHISLENDETLEHNDGLTYRIIYSKITNGDWQLGGRIKGFPNGFEKLNLAFNSKGKPKQTLIILWSVFFFLTLTRIIVLAIAKKPLVFRPKELLFILVLLVCTSYMTVEYYFHSINLIWYH
jgi:hypothetical protein